jgi:hypothetical protein
VVAVSRTIAFDERARVPFALVGVVLLLTSATFTVALSREAPESEPAVDVVMERTIADARAAVREAIVAAATRAARNPVAEPADTRYGQVLSGSAPFRDSLRTRIYLTARDAVGAVGNRRDGVGTTVSLPAVSSPSSLEDALGRVRVRRVEDNRTALGVDISGLTVTAERNGRTVGRRNVTLSLRVASPVLAAHDRVVEFQSRLDAGLDRPGLTQRVTGTLYAAAWARGYAQYGGTPIQNVIGNRHVSVLTNGAVLGIQRSVFGRSDPDGRRAHAWALKRVAIRDVAGPALRNHAGFETAVKQVVRAGTRPTESVGPPDSLATAGAEEPAPNDTMDVSVGRSADFVFEMLYDAERVNRTIETVYSAAVERRVATNRTERARAPDPDPPGPNWTHEGTGTRRTVTNVANVTETGRGPSAPVPEGYHVLQRYAHIVTIRETRTARWRRGDELAVTNTTDTGTVRVAVAVVGDHALSDHAPERGIATVHVPGGRFDGPNLENVTERAVASLVSDAGGSDAVARAAVDGGPGGQVVSRTVRGDVPPALYDRVYLELASLRDRLRNVSTSVERAKLGTFEATPAADLRARLAHNRSAYLDAPDTYPAVASKAIVAARAAYFDRVLAALEARAAQRADRAKEVDNRLQKEGNLSLATVRDSREVRDEGRSTGGSNPVLDYRVDGAPPYLTLTGLTHEQVPAIDPDETVYPLTARNTNLGTIPYAQVVNGIIESVTSGPKTSLGTAAKTLQAANRTLETTGNESLASQRASLAAEIRTALGDIRDRYTAILTDHGVGNDTTESIIRDAFGDWRPVHGRALAAANGSIARRVAALAERRAPAQFDSERAVDWFEFRLREATHASLDAGAQVGGSAVKQVADGVETVAKAEINRRVGDRIDETISQLRKRWGSKVNLVPAGIPITPAPGYWYATMNLWTVRVTGTYERFAVEVPRRTPATGDATLQYVRDGANVTLDVNGDGETERLGRATRVGFETGATVVVVVPPYGQGVGDRNGMTVERSPGWESRSPDNWTAAAKRYSKRFWNESVGTEVKSRPNSAPSQSAPSLRRDVTETCRSTPKTGVCSEASSRLQASRRPRNYTRRTWRHSARQSTGSASRRRPNGPAWTRRSSTRSRTATLPN